MVTWSASASGSSSSGCSSSSHTGTSRTVAGGSVPGSVGGLLAIRLVGDVCGIRRVGGLRGIRVVGSAAPRRRRRPRHRPRRSPSAASASSAPSAVGLVRDLRQVLVVVVDDQGRRPGSTTAQADGGERGAPVVVGLLAGVHRVVEPPQLGGEHLDGPDVLAGQRHHHRAEQPELGDQAGPHEQVGVGALDPGVRVGLEHGLDRLGRGVGDERGEVVGGVGHLGVLPAGDRADLARWWRRCRR